MQKIQNLIPLVKPFYPSDDPSHDWPHIGRVMNLAKKLSSGTNANVEVLLAGVCCHDIVNLPKNHPDRTRASELAAEKAVPFLIEAGFNQSEVEHIKQVVIEHSFSKGLRPTSLEAAILQDADRLDTLGAIGVLRCATVNTLMKSSYYEPFDPLAEERELDDKKYMLDHYFVKIFKLPELMNTENGKKEANERMGFMKLFVDQLMKEVRS